MKKNNKGFSLVELIVVVLIMGILAVALAPQVMKWVQKASESSKKNDAQAVKGVLQDAIADYMSNGSTIKAEVNITAWSSTGVNAVATDTNFSDGARFKNCVDEVTGGDYSSKVGAIKITTAGVVTVNEAP